ncbi:hypothetical protein K0M31_007885 [Melipona bicolor]|uniref:Uncharacterized protein n=1 Tax=Melipona bicolor TaxID=60889 RepID=A0AA40GCI1_9HYME|nr:hypothetical protein K0M31_007885 [Melipona bicolor]
MPGQCWSSATTTPVARPWNLRSARKTPGRIDTSTVVNVAACYPPTMQSAALPTASGLCNERRRRNSAVSGLRSSTNPRVSFPYYPPDYLPTPLRTPFVPVPPIDHSKEMKSKMIVICLFLETTLKYIMELPSHVQREETLVSISSKSRLKGANQFG